MYTLINAFLIFIFIIIILFLKLPNIENNNHILNKLIIFLLLFIYQFIILIIIKIIMKCKIDLMQIFKDSIETAIIGIIGYSIYNDLQYSKIKLFSININSKISYLYIAIIIIFLLI